MLPESFLNRMKEMLSDDYEEFLESFSKDTYRALRVNTRKTSVEEFLRVAPFTLSKVPWTENGFYYDQNQKPGKHPLHETGVYYIQEPSAMAPVPYLEVKEGDRVLDLCAAPGGKTSQIADCLSGKGLLVCNEIHPTRAKILSENVERMGIGNALVTNETPENLAMHFEGFFDKILVDAPCSGEGMFRKNEDASSEWSPEHVVLCAQRQDDILDKAEIMLRAGGRLVYSTCTFAPLEDEGTISRFLQRHPEFHIIKVQKKEEFTNGMGSLIENPGDGIEDTIRLMPHKVKGEGHFIAVLEKGEETTESIKANPLGGYEKNIPEKDYMDFMTFTEQYLENVDFHNGTFLKFGDQLYYAPKELPLLKGLKVLRPGLHLGTMKKNRFEPSHALALYLHENNVKQVLSYTISAIEPEQFLKGQTIILSDETSLSGWCLICIEHYSLGWGKIAGTIVKNHYPKGLRIV